MQNPALLAATVSCTVSTIPSALLQNEDDR